MRTKEKLKADLDSYQAAVIFVANKLREEGLAEGLLESFMAAIPKNLSNGQVAVGLASTLAVFAIDTDDEMARRYPHIVVAAIASLAIEMLEVLADARKGEANEA